MGVSAVRGTSLEVTAPTFADTERERSLSCLVFRREVMEGRSPNRAHQLAECHCCNPTEGGSCRNWTVAVRAGQG